MATSKGREDEYEELIPLFPVDSLIPDSPCPHKGPIPEGSRLVCMICFRSGRDHLSKVYHHEKPKRYWDIDEELKEQEINEIAAEALRLREEKWQARRDKKKGLRNV